MMLIVAVSLLALALAFGLLLMARNSGATAGTFHDIDIQAFRRLLDPADIAMLRESLAADSFSRLQKQRARVAWRYLKQISENASLVMKLSSAPELRQLPEYATLEREALQVRWLAFRARLAIALWFIRPGAEIQLALPTRYMAVRARFEQMNRAQGQRPLVNEVG